MRKSFILLTICALAGLWSCQSRIEDETPITYASDESEVEITVAADRTPRNVPSATPDENIIDNLDILLFDSNGKFICWRATFKINGKLRTTLPVGKDYDAYFLANCRSFIGEMLPDKVTENNTGSRRIGKSSEKPWLMQTLKGCSRKIQLLPACPCGEC